jgi:predicted dehydrogenase
VEVAAVAARDVGRARVHSAEHGIPRVHTGYRHLLEDPGIDAVYDPLPNRPNGAWTLRAIETGKYVMSEKPFTANATEARTVAVPVAVQDRVVMEAFHYRYNPMLLRVL